MQILWETLVLILFPMSKRKNTTYVWSARNSVNGLEYGYGGVKLFQKVQLLELGHELTDYTTGASFYRNHCRRTANITRFNKDLIELGEVHP